MDSAFHRDFLSFFYVFHFFVHLHSPSYQNYCLESLLHFNNSYAAGPLSLLSSQAHHLTLLSRCSPLFHLLPLLKAVVKFLCTDVSWPKTNHYSDWVILSRVCQSLSGVRLFGTPGTVSPQSPLSVGFPRWEYRTGLPFPTSQREVDQSYSTLCDPMDCSLPGSSVHGLFQAIVLEWIASPSCIDIVVAVVFVVQSPSPVQLFVTLWTAALQASLCLTISRSLPKFTFIALVMPFSRFILCHPLFLLPPSGTFPKSHLFPSDDQNTGASVLFFLVSIQGCSPLRFTGSISLLSKRLSGVFSSTNISSRIYCYLLFDVWLINS